MLHNLAIFLQPRRKTTQWHIYPSPRNRTIIDYQEREKEKEGQLKSTNRIAYNRANNRRDYNRAYNRRAYNRAYNRRAYNRAYNHTYNRIYKSTCFLRSKCTFDSKN